MQFSESKRVPSRAARRLSPMRRVGLLACALWLAMAAGVAWAQTMDLVLVLDNSGSMRKNDPQFLLKPAVRGFVGELGGETRVGMVVFDQGVRYPVALRPLDEEARAAIESGLETIDYRGKFTDSAAAIERAIYELKSQGRADAARVIVFMTDGIVDTGNAALDAERAKWLREDLAAEAAEEGIRIFSVAFTEQADFFLAQSLARKSGGEYFRAAQPEDLAPVFATVRERVAALLAATPAPAAPAAADAASAATCLGRLDPEERAVLMEAATAAGMDAEAMCAQMEEAAPGTVIVHAPPPAADAAAEPGNTLGLVVLLASAVLLLAVVLVAVLVLRRKSQARPGEPAPAPVRGTGGGAAAAAQVPEAYLKDVHGITHSGDVRLGARPLLIGRVAGSDPEHVDYFVVDQGTVGRRHALIQYRDFAFWVSDQGSVNGTFVNGQRISSERQLRHGDRVMFHKYEFEFSMPELENAEHTVFASAHDRTLVADATMVGAPVVTAAAAAAVAAARADELDVTAEAPDVQDAPSTPALWAERDETALSARAAADSAAALDAESGAPAATPTAADEGEGEFEADASAFFDDYPVPQTGETFHPGDPAVETADDDLVTVLPASVADDAADGEAPFTEAETLLPPAPYAEEDAAADATADAAAEAEEPLDEVSLDDFMATESFYRHAPVDDERADVTLMPDQVSAPLDDPVDDFFDITSDHPELPADDEDAETPPRSRD